jgi:hypothetical protein
MGGGGGGHLTTHGGDGNFTKIVTTGHEEKGPLGKPRCKLEYKFKLIVRKCESRVWSVLSVSRQ